MVAALGLRRNNPGNIEYGPGVQKMKGLVLPHDGNRFCAFRTMPLGIRAIAIVLMNYQDNHGIDTVRRAIERWAPPGAKDRNPTDAYIRNVCAWSGMEPDRVQDFQDDETMFGLVRGICWQENGQHCVSDDQVRAGIAAAGFTGAVKPLAKSNTIKGAQIAGGVGGGLTLATGVAQQVSDVAAPIGDAVGALYWVGPVLKAMLPYLPWVALAAILIGVGWIIVERVKRHNQGIV